MNYYAVGKQAVDANQVVLINPNSRAPEKDCHEAILLRGNGQLRNPAFQVTASTLVEAAHPRPEYSEAHRFASAANYQLVDFYFRNKAYRTIQSLWQKWLALDAGFISNESKHLDSCWRF